MNDPIAILLTLMLLSFALIVGAFVWAKIAKNISLHDRLIFWIGVMTAGYILRSRIQSAQSPRCNFATKSFENSIRPAHA